MKTTKQIMALVFAASVIAFGSCSKKDWTCECTITYHTGNKYIWGEVYRNQKKQEARTACQVREAFLSADEDIKEIECKLK